MNQNQNLARHSYRRQWTLYCLGVALTLTPALGMAQPPGSNRAREAKRLANPSDATRAKQANLIEEVVEPELTLEIEPGRSKLIRTKLPVTRIAITDPEILEINEFGPNEFEIIGLRAGETTMTVWFQELDGTIKTLRYLVKVLANESQQFQAEVEFAKLESRINELFPNSQILLFPIADKLIVRGQARDSKEASEIISLLTESNNQGGNGYGWGGNAAAGVVRLPGAENLRLGTVINLIHVPGEQQVLLKVRIAELTRSAGRDLGMDFSVIEKNLRISNLIGGAGNITAILDGGDVNLFIKAFSSNGYGKLLAEPTLVTISGQPATFIAGGEFAVPTTVGVQGVGAVSTTFQGFGTRLAFTPTVIDKDKIRLQVAPSFSTLNNEEARVNGIPGMNTRAVATTVDLREGQWLAIAGLIQDEQKGTRKRVPFIGDIPVAGAAFGAQNKKRDETELIVLVSPELVHPLEPEQAPLLLPGMEVTDPTDAAFYLLQHTEGHPEVHHRSTVWPQHRQQVLADHWIQKHRSNKTYADHHVEQDYYLSGPHGFSE